MFFLKKKKIPFNELVTPDFIDIHSHLIPGVDDGTKTMEDSLDLLRQFKAMGVDTLITSPHIMQDVWPNTTQGLREGLQNLEHQRSPDCATLRVAAEYMLDDLFQQRLKNKDLLTLKDDFILVELSHFNPPLFLEQITFDINIAGYVPILAHPERYSYYHQEYKQYAALKDLGFHFQVNLLSLNGFYGSQVQKIAARLLEDGLIDFVGSDVHNVYQFCKLKEGFRPAMAKLLDSVMKNNIVFKS